MFRWLAEWWNAVELWVLGLPFPFQFALVMVVLLPACVGLAWLIDRIVDHVSAAVGPAHASDPPVGSASLEQQLMSAEAGPR